MSHDECMRAKMEETFRTSPWMGIVSKEEALAQQLRHRESLSDAERALYDEHVMHGHHPSNAAQLIGLMREAGLIPADESLVLDKAS